VKGLARTRGLTLVELLVVIGIIAMLMTVLMPSLQRARALARSAVCKAQLGGLVRANQLYAADNEYLYVPAASDIFWGAAGNLHRWHGVRQDLASPFDPTRGPMARYLGYDGRVKQCPSFTRFRTGTGAISYEAGSGGYGYSDIYVGSQFWKYGFYHNSPGQRLGAPMEEVSHPAETVTFADAAMPQAFGGKGFYVEESFCYCPLGLDHTGRVSTALPRQPSIHFRHLDQVNVGWCDGHVTERGDFRSITSNVYQANPHEMMVGWFGPDDNSLFDLD
jgi:prepilin-type processing-associated H-X9-DG protein/prepilin-type N-terminal cleavage/methylation domain-containing protein